jgi:hypothetical protein
LLLLVSFLAFLRLFVVFWFVSPPLLVLSLLVFFPAGFVFFLLALHKSLLMINVSALVA